MKKILSLIIFLILCINTAYASEYILPTEYKNIKIYDSSHIIVAEDKNSKTAIYDFSGKKISADYDKIHDFGKNQVAIAINEGKHYLINNQGTIVNEFEEKLLGVFSNNLVFVDMGNNNDGRPLNKYEGNFAVCNFQGNNSVLLPYKKFIHPQKSTSIGFGFSGNRMIFFENEKCGAVDLELNPVIPAEYDMIYPFTCDYTIAVKDNKYGIIDSLGNIKVDFIYDYIEDIGVFKTKKGNKFGIITKYGKVIYDTTLELEPICFFSDYNMIEVKDNITSFSGIIDFYGNTILPAQYTQILEIQNGVIETNNGFYSLQGKLLPEYVSSEPPEKEFSVVSNDKFYGVVKNDIPKKEPLWDFEYIDFPDTYAPRETENGYIFTRSDQSEIYLDKFGNETNDAVLIRCSNVFPNGLSETILRDNQNREFASFDYTYFTPESENEILVLSDHDEYTNKEFKIYSKENGELLLDTKYIHYQNPVNGTGFPIINKFGYFAFRNEIGLCGISDVRGNIIVDPEYENILLMNDKFKAKKADKWTILDIDGTKITEFDSGEPYVYSDCPQYTVLELENNGKKFLNSNYDLISEFDDMYIKNIPCDGVIITYNDRPLHTLTGSEELIDIYGNIIIPAGNHQIEYIGENIFKVKNNEAPYEIRLIDINGKILADNCKYVTNVGDNGYIGISKDNFEGYIDTDGNTVLVLNDYHVSGAFSEGLAAVLGKKSVIFSNYGEISYINEQGTLMLQGAEWCSGGEFKNGLITVGTNLGKSGPQDFKLVKCTYDTPSEWAEDYIAEAVLNKLLPENLQNRYKKNITRESFCEIAFNLPIIKKALDGSNLSSPIEFTDTDNEKIRLLSALGIINGVGSNKFAPNNFITREEAATILHRICLLTNTLKQGETSVFSDDTQISDWAKESVYAMQIAGIMNGVGNNTFAPKDGYTTEQTVATILRIYTMEE